jgi:hypothetical protein
MPYVGHEEGRCALPSGAVLDGRIGILKYLGLLHRARRISLQT